ncbi:MAG: Transposase [Mitsuokella multacida]|jgi:putative transposase
MSALTQTIKFRLMVTSEQAALFRQMTEQYRQACNAVSQYIFDHTFCLNTSKLNEALYRDIRQTFGLKSQMAQSTFKTVVARYRTVKEQLRQKPYRYQEEDGSWHRLTKTLEWLWHPVEFRRPQADLVRGRDYSFVHGGQMLSINTLDGRIRCPFASHPLADCLDGSWKLGTAKLVELKGLWYLHIPASKEVEDFQKEQVRHVVGIDRGLRFLSVCYDEQEKTLFESGKKIATKRHKFQEVRRQLQTKGTKSAKRKLKAISGRENRWMSDVNHRISKTLVEKYGSDTLFVLEDLTGVSFESANLSRSAKQKYDLRSWSFYQLEQFLTYKAHQNRSEVLKVSARYTSQRCPKCGAICKTHRNHQKHLYHCTCGYQSNDDRIGAMNIYELGCRWLRGEENPHYQKL